MGNNNNDDLYISDILSSLREGLIIFTLMINTHEVISMICTLDSDFFSYRVLNNTCRNI